MGDNGTPPRRLRDFVAGIRATGSGCWRFKSNGGRIPTDPIGLANRSVRNSSMMMTSSYANPGDHLSGDGSTRYSGVTVPGIGLSDGVEARRVPVNDEDDEELPRNFRNNTVKTSKYNPLSFLPIFLFEMFSRVAYLYFLLQAGLSWWEIVSPFGGLGATAALGFVLLMSGGKAIIEDMKRHAEDEKMNNSWTTIVHPLTGKKNKIKWKDIKVGDIIKVEDDELFPADLLCLNTGLQDGVCFIKTTNLDGESNLKIRKSVDLRSVPEGFYLPTSCDSEKWVFNHSAILECEPPNKNLHKFKGRFTLACNSLGGERLDQHISLPVSMNEMLLRGTLLKNSQHVHGLVVYTGHDTRIQMNAAKVPLKMGSFDLFLNVQIIILIVAQIIFCLILAAMNLYWKDHSGIERAHLAFDMFVEGNYRSSAKYLILVFLTFWILTSYMVPISLFVTMEIVKFWQAFVFINNDATMMTEDEPARARNSNLNEDLGKIEYIFSDKTGTLTSNDMQLRLISIKNQICGRQDFKLEEVDEDLHGIEALEAFDHSLAKSVGHLKEKGFWAALMSTGGSGQFILSLPSSSPNLKKMLPMDRDNLNDELKRFYRIGCPEDVGHLDVYDGPSSRQDSIDSLRTPSAKLAIRTRDVGEVVFGWHIVDFWTTICVCHSLITEERTDEFGEVHREYQGPSPDEVALVEAARKLGFEFRERTLTGIVLSMQGLEVRYEILNVLEFTSDRKRMSIVVQSPDGTIHLFVKGADTVMLPRLKEPADSPLVAETKTNLHKYSTMGLRTLILGSKILDEKTYQAWDAEYQMVAGSLSDNQEEELNRMAEKLERDLELVGLTAIEDKLQEGVPMAIKTLRMAGMKIWMITGDKMETAINIALSCQLIVNKDSILVLQAEHHWDARDRLRELLKIANARKKLGQTVELCVDGPSLVHILGKNLEVQLAQLGSKCSGVVICRSSPSQKAAVVRIMREYEMRQIQKEFGAPIFGLFKRQKAIIKTKMLAIGDGANDVTMIQAADIGVGIAGKEGRQAVNNSDYSLGQFRFLVRLLLVHGQLSHYRLARLIKFSFFKNITFAFILIFYQFYCGFSGQALVDDISAAVYNVAFTALPILLFAVLDRFLDDRTLIRFPQLYNMNSSLRTIVFWRSGVMQGILNAAVCFFIPYYSVTAAGKSNSDSLWALGKTIFVGLLGVVTLEVALIGRYWTEFFMGVLFLSFVLVFPYLLLFPYVEQSLNMYDHKQFGIAENLFSTSHFWLCTLAIITVSFGCRIFFRAAKWLFNPDDNMILAEFESSKGPLGELTQEERVRLSSLDAIPPSDPPQLPRPPAHSEDSPKINSKWGHRQHEERHSSQQEELRSIHRQVA